MELVYFLASQVSVSFACCERVIAVKFGIIPVSTLRHDSDEGRGKTIRVMPTISTLAMRIM